MEIEDNNEHYAQAALLACLEKEARSIATSVDTLTEHLVVSLHTVSCTVLVIECLETVTATILRLISYEFTLILLFLDLCCYSGICNSL